MAFFRLVIYLPTFFPLPVQIVVRNSGRRVPGPTFSTEPNPVECLTIRPLVRSASDLHGQSGHAVYDAMRRRVTTSSPPRGTSAGNVARGVSHGR